MYHYLLYNEHEPINGVPKQWTLTVNNVALWLVDAALKNDQGT